MNWCNPQIHHFISKSKTQMSEKWSGVHYSSGWRIAMLAIANKIRRIRSAAGPSQWCFFKWSSGDQTYKTTKLSVQRLFVTCLAAETLEMNWQWMMKVSEALLGRGKDPPVRGSKTSGENSEIRENRTFQLEVRAYLEKSEEVVVQTEGNASSSVRKTWRRSTESTFLKNSGSSGTLTSKTCT